MMKKTCLLHIITIGALVVFVVLGLASGSTPSYSSGSSSSSSGSGSSSGCPGDGSCSMTTGSAIGLGTACYSSGCAVRRANGRIDLPDNTTISCDC